MEKVWLNHYSENVKKEIETSNISLPQMLQERISNYGDRPALHFSGNEITYKKLGERVDAFAASLQDIGLKKGDRIAIMLPNCPQYVVSYYGVLKMGGIVAQINPMLFGRELEYILNDSGAKSIVIAEQLFPVLNKIIDNTSVKHVIKVNFEGKETEYSGVTDFDTFLTKGTKTPKPININAHEDLAVLQYTGGTTGRSKGVMLTHHNLLASVMQAYEFFTESIELGKERILTVIPLFHVFGMSSGMNFAIFTGSLNILLPKFDVEEVLQTIKEMKPTIFPGVPTMYIALINHPKVDKYGLDSIKVCNSGSAPIPGEVLRTFEKKTGAIILEGYGLSESSTSAHCNPYTGKRKLGSVGIGLPSTDYKIVDLVDGEKELPAGESGEIIIKGPQITKGYWNMPEETSHAIRDGWLYTGDIAYMDEDGYLFIVDRKKDLIIVSGYNVYPRDIEEILYEHPSIMDAVVVGVPDPYRGETVKAVVVLKEGQQSNEKELISYCQKNIATYKVPKIIEFRDELPKTNVGKILRRQIRDESVKAAEK